MLRNVLIMAASGIVLFSKEYANAVAQPRLVGSLVTAMLEFSTKATGARVSFIEMSSVGVTVVTNDKEKVFIALFHDPTDAASFTSFIAREILDDFIAQHGTELGNVGHNLRDFHRFQMRIVGVVRDSVKPILRKLQQQRGIMKAIFVADGAVTHATVDVDQIGVLANLEALVNLSYDMMSFSGSGVNSLTIQSSRNTTIQVTAVDKSIDTLLIVMYKKGPQAARNLAAIHQCVQMLRSVCVLVRCLQHTAR